MPFKITSPTNPRLKSLLQEADSLYLFEGEKLVQDILDRGLALDKLIVEQGREESLVFQPERVGEFWLVGKRVLEKISRLKEPPACIAVLSKAGRRINWPGEKVVLGFDRVQDPANLGSALRCAAAFSAGAVALCGSSVRPNNPKLLRAAQTALFDVPLQPFATLAELLETARRHRFQIHMTSGRSDIPTLAIDRICFPALIVFGSEGQGLPEELLREFPVLRLPQSDQVDSLNLGVAACILMYELQKLRNVGR